MRPCRDDSVARTSGSLNPVVSLAALRSGRERATSDAGKIGLDDVTWSNMFVWSAAPPGHCRRGTKPRRARDSLPLFQLDVRINPHRPLRRGNNSPLSAGFKAFFSATEAPPRCLRVLLSFFFWPVTTLLTRPFKSSSASLQVLASS